MRWARVRNGLYKAGPYTVISHDTHRPCWTATGPGVPENSLHGTKVDAQAEAVKACVRRLLGEGQAECETVIGDKVVVTGGHGHRRQTGVVRSIMRNSSPNQRAIYCLGLAHGKRLCLFREEFEVVMP